MQQRRLQFHQRQTTNMHLILNDNSFEIYTVRTEFSEYWKNDWLFKDADAVNAKFSQHHALRNKADVQVKAEKLRRLVTRVNEISQSQGLDSRYIYDDTAEIPSMEMLANTHERWANVTLKAFEHDHIDESVVEAYAAINSILKEEGFDYTQINNFVHDVEFAYKFFFLHDVEFERDAIGRQYEIKPSDTSFVQEFMCIPYYDIGRPQFEKFQVSNQVSNPEISNYIAVTNRVHLTGNVRQEVVPFSYYEQTSSQGISAYGNHVPVCKSALHSPYAFGEFIMTNCQDLEDSLRIVRS